MRLLTVKRECTSVGAMLLIEKTDKKHFYRRYRSDAPLFFGKRALLVPPKGNFSRELRHRINSIDTFLRLIFESMIDFEVELIKLSIE